MAGEAVASPMRPATAPGRSARPAPPGNDDPCEERRTIPEGLPSCPERPSREVSDGWFESPEAFGEGGPTTASTGPGQKSHVERRKGERTRRRATQDVSPHRMSGLPDMRQVKLRAGWPEERHIERGRGLPAVRNERKAGICSGLLVR